MADSSQLAKAIFALLLIVLLATLVANQPPPGASLPPANTSLSNFQSTFTQGFPTFDNPFSQNSMTTAYYVTGNDTSGASNFYSAVGCANATYYECLQTNDGSASGIILSAAHPNVEVVMSFANFSNSTTLERVYVKLSCSSVGTSAGDEVAIGRLFMGGQSIDTQTLCPIGFTNFTFDFPAPNAFNHYQFSANQMGINIAAAVGVPPPGNKMLDISYFEVDIVTEQAPATCSGDFFTSTACTIGQFAATIFNGILFVFNGGIFIVSIVAWFLTLIVNFLAIFVGSLIWILTIPGTPPLVTGILVAVVGMLLVLIVLAFADRLPIPGRMG